MEGRRVSTKNEEVTASTINFIKKFSVESSHYGRGDSAKQYLSSDLNITKIWRI